MSKEITPLDALKEIENSLENTDNLNLFNVCNLKVIETALKENQRLKERLDKVCKMHNNALRKIESDRKKLKALEIIKERLRHFIDYDETKTIYIDGAIDCDNQEYDLLKEVLK